MENKSAGEITEAAAGDGHYPPRPAEVAPEEPEPAGHDPGAIERVCVHAPQGTSPAGEEAQNTVGGRLRVNRSIPIDETDLTERVRRILKRCGCATLGDVAVWTEQRLLAMKGFGPSCLLEVQTALQQVGLELVVEHVEPVAVESPPPPEPVKEDCGGCNAWCLRVDVPGKGECRAELPMAHVRVFGNRIVADGYWPLIEADKWCRKFVRKGH